MKAGQSLCLQKLERKAEDVYLILVIVYKHFITERSRYSLEKKENYHQIAVIWHLAWPAMIEFGFQTILQYVDLYMVGTLGVDSTAIVGLCAQLQFLIKFPINGLSIGVLSVIAQLYGEKNYPMIKKATIQALYYATVTGSIFFVLTMAFSGIFPTLFGVEVSLKQAFTDYFRISYSTVLFFAITSIVGSLLRAVGDMKSPMVINALINILNIILNFLFIYETRSIELFHRKIKIPGAGMGLKGAALGTAISIFIGGLVMLYQLKKYEMTNIKNADWRMDVGIQKNFIVIGAPAAITNIMTGTGRMIFTTYISLLGTISLAAHSIAYTAESFFYIPAVGLEKATATLAGNYLGEKDGKKLKEMTRCGILLACGGMLVMGAILFVFAKPLSSVFTKDSSVAAFSGSCLQLIAFTEPLFGLSVLMQGILEGMGETKKVLFMSTASMWSFRVFFCYFVLVRLGYGLEAAWLCMAGDNICRALLLTYVFCKGKWRDML